MNKVKWVSGCALVWMLAVCASAFGQLGAPEGGRAPAESGRMKDGAKTETSLLVDHRNLSANVQDTSTTFCQCVGEADSPAVARIEQVLNGPLHSSGIDYAETPLQDIVTALQEDYGIPIQLDAQALQAGGKTTDEPISMNLHNISLRAALRLMLKPVQLTYVIKDEVLQITTPEEAASNIKLCVYDVSSLAGDQDAQLNVIIDTIVSCVATDTWATNGGRSAEIRPIKPGLLVISQTAAVHEEIRNLLATLRKMREANPSAASGADAAKAASVVTRSYRLQLNPTDDMATVRSQVHDLIVQSLPDEAWNGKLEDGEGVALAVFHDRVVVRHKPSVQEKVQRILIDSGLAIPVPPITDPVVGNGEFVDGAALIGPEPSLEGGVPAGIVPQPAAVDPQPAKAE